MKKVRIASVVLMVALVAVTGVAYAVVEAPYTDADCATCHGDAPDAIALSKVDFSAANVDPAKCRACHAAIPVPSWDDHFHGYYSSCGWLCHGLIDEPTFSEPAGEVIEPLVRTSYGYFQSVDSPYAEVAEIHQAHLGQGWVNITFQSIDPSCAPCHGAASCNACHTDPVHGDHGGTLSCTDAGCHPAAAPSEIPSCIVVGCHPEAKDAYHEKSHTADMAGQCTNCHEMELATEHAKYYLGCATCHTAAYAGVVAEWNRTCDACHSQRHRDRDSGGGGKQAGRN